MIKNFKTHKINNLLKLQFFIILKITKNAKLSEIQNKKK